MLDKQALAGMWDMLRVKHGIMLRLIEAMPEDKLHTRLVPGMRTAAQLIVHVYGTVVRDIPEAVVKGRLESEGEDEEKLTPKLQTRQALLDYAHACWADGSKAAATVTDAQLAAMVPTPWNMSLPGWMMFGVTADEFLHHRGQLYAFARAMGVEPPMMWDFEHNAEPYRPKHAMTA